VICEDTDIEDCHRIKGDRTIIKFSSRRKVKEVFSNKNKLKNVSNNDLGFPEGKIYINDSLCPYYRGLWGKCKQSLIDKKIYSFWTSNGTLRVKINQMSTPRVITHDVDLSSL